MKENNKYYNYNYKNIKKEKEEENSQKKDLCQKQVCVDNGSCICGAVVDERVSIGKAILILVLIIIAWLAISTVDFMWTKYVLFKIRSIWALFFLAILVGALYLSLSAATNTFLFIPS